MMNRALNPTIPRIAVSLVLALMCGSIHAATSIAATSPTPWNTNLVRNGGAEAGPASSDGYQDVNAPYWHFTDAFTVVRYGQSGGKFPTLAESNRIAGGNQFFAPGPATDPDCDLASQRIRIRGHGRAIDRGHVKVVVSAWVATAEDIEAKIDLSFLDGRNHSVGALPMRVARVSGTHRTFVHVSRSQVVPTAARTLGLRLTGNGADGNVYCWAFFDRLTVRIVHV
jgi:hypothetical protein